jgi:branched-chain amino acid transport system ATP-binding protein
MTALIEARDLDVFYGASHILRGVSLRLAAGEALGLMGRNGMGKTTLLRTIMGLVRPRHGAIVIDGADVTGTATFQIASRGIAYVPEGRGIFASLTVAENLAIAARGGVDGHSDWPMERILTLFPRLGERLSNKGHQLSGGEQQMLAIGRALLTNPRALILDEATEGLAPLVREQIWQTVKVVRQAGIATIIVDKSVADVASVADRIVVLVKGETAFEGPPATLIADEALMHRHLGV